MKYVGEYIGIFIVMIVPFIIWLGEPDLHDYLLRWAETWSSCK